MTVTSFRPFLIGAGTETLRFWERINWKWLLQRTPMLLFALVSSYGVGHLLYLMDIPQPFYSLGGISFDVGFLGVIALSDMQLTKTWQSHVLYYVLNVTMAGLAALFNVLSHANAHYANITWEDITVGAPFAIVGLAFAIYYNSMMSIAINNEILQQEQDNKLAELTKEKCKYCGEGKPTIQAVYGHYRNCAMKKMHTDNRSECKCLLCTA